MADRPHPSADEILAACRFSGLDDVRGVRRRSGGDLSSVFEVDAQGRQWIVKVYSPQWAWKQRKEEHVYSLFRGVSDVLLPKIIDVQDQSSPLGLAYTVMTCLPGAPLSEAEPDLDAVRHLYRSIGELTAALHSVHQDAYGYVVTSVLDPAPDNAAYMTTQFEKKMADYVAAGDPGRLSAVIGQRVTTGVRALQDCIHPVLCHNDLHEGNLLVDRSERGWTLTGVIDVENAVAADPLLDLAKTHVYSIRGDETKAKALADGYRLRLDDSAQVRFDLYRIYHTLELWNWFHQLGRAEHLHDLQRQLAALAGG